MTHSSRIKHRFSVACIAATFIFGGYSLGSGVTRADADQAYTAWFNLYFNKSNNTFYKKDNKTGLIDFWRYAHDWENILDRYELTRDPALLATLKDTWIGFNKTNGTGYDWKQNDYNDDIEWWIISSTRAYMLTQDTAYLNTAKKSFDWLYSTQWDMALGGGIWWKNNEKGSKNACSNGPGARAALNLYAITQDAAYLDKAKAIYKWERDALFNANSGAISDSKQANGSVANFTLFYNQGTFLGPAMELFKITGDSSYYREGIKAIDYVKNNMSNRTTGILNGGGNTGDFAAFLVIFVRNMMDVIMDQRQTQYLGWMNANADAAWNNRRKTDNIMSSNFGSAAGSGLESSSSTGGVAMVTLAVLAAQPIGIAIPKKNIAIHGLVKQKNAVFTIDGRMFPDFEKTKSTLLLQRAPNGEVLKSVSLR